MIDPNFIIYQFKQKTSYHTDKFNERKWLAMAAQEGGRIELLSNVTTRVGN